jgi:hypothetical protein
MQVRPGDGSGQHAPRPDRRGVAPSHRSPAHWVRRVEAVHRDEAGALRNSAALWLPLAAPAVSISLADVWLRIVPMLPPPG